MAALARQEVNASDKAILRELAKQKREISERPENIERRRLWYQLDACQAERPMVLAESWVAFENLPDAQYQCAEEWAREIERGLRFDIWQFHNIRDDHVIEPHITCNWDVHVSDLGLTSTQHYAERVSGNVSSRHWDPPMTDIERDFEKLHPRTFSVDREATLARKALLEDLFGGILETRIRGGFWWTVGLTGTLIDLVGLQEMMVLMCTHPDAMHRLLDFLKQDVIAYADWLEKEQLLSLNNENDYIGSGSMGYTRALPQPDWKQGGPVRLKDLWVLSESQETVLCSPAQCEEFVFTYYRPIAAKFGLTYYGCCEPVHSRWESLKTLPNLKRLSISPWCDEAFMAETLGRDYVYSRKPNPALISVTDFDEDLIRADLRKTVTTARNCNVEIIMKDVHTLAGQPQRMARWVQIAREVIAEAGF